MSQILYPVLIVGAGPSGLAVGACLQRAGIRALILEQTNTVGSAWHNHYERLHLHTDKGHSALPYLPLPKIYPRYPSRLQVIEYLEMYARQFQLDVRFNQKVIDARQVKGVWQVQTEDAQYQAQNLVIAAGYNREPYLPQFAGQANYRGTLLHSSQYRTGETFEGQQVLVVGFGNSGGEIAIDLYEQGARPSLAVRNPVNVIPRELFGMPILAIGIAQSKLPPRVADVLTRPILSAVIGDLAQYGLRKLPYGPATQIRQNARIPLIDVGTLELIKRGKITVYPGIEKFTQDGVTFTDGTHKKFDAVIFATGFRPRVNSFLKDAAAAYDENGTPLASGSESSLAGLYFCGYYISPTGMLREITAEAKRISASIARKHPA